VTFMSRRFRQEAIIESDESETVSQHVSDGAAFELRPQIYIQPDHTLAVRSVLYRWKLRSLSEPRILHWVNSSRRGVSVDGERGSARPRRP
jgi:hypothetical protein